MYYFKNLPSLLDLGLYFNSQHSWPDRKGTIYKRFSLSYHLKIIKYTIMMIRDNRDCLLR